MKKHLIELTIVAGMLLAALAHANDKKIHEAWYVVKAGKSVVGYYQEMINLRDNKYYYRYAMITREGTAEKLENFGAVAEADLTPIAMNISRTALNATETVDGKYVKKSGDTPGGEMTIQVRGARVATFKRTIAPGVFLDVFVPVWLMNNWSKVTPGSKHKLNLFAEIPGENDFRPQLTLLTVGADDKARGCRNIEIKNEILTAHWCTNDRAGLVHLEMNETIVDRVANEAAAKRAFEAKTKKK